MLPAESQKRISLPTIQIGQFLKLPTLRGTGQHFYEKSLLVGFWMENISIY